ncbi:DinB family protein [Paenibacillus sepulcri]|uniref:DinB family protein n=1 Tax=Paenibacillus sepulcri TaxID=359917 RepID=A0ABS7BV69_9BACL|nr:DinB family protein [Paenibacillus sepulcri]
MNDKNIQSTTDCIRHTLHFQFEISWKMLEIHLDGLEDEEYLWRPASKGLHVFNESGVWRADWPESEAYDIGPASIAWLTWHIMFWWTMVLDYSFGKGTLTREDVSCPGNIIETRERITHLRHEWKTAVAKLLDDELLSNDRTRWPFTDKPFHALAGWLNLELIKNAAEIGYCRFLYAAQKK